MHKARRYSLVLVPLLFAIFLTACGTTPGSSPSEDHRRQPAQDPGQPTRITGEFPDHNGTDSFLLASTGSGTGVGGRELMSAPVFVGSLNPNGTFQIELAEPSWDAIQETSLCLDFPDHALILALHATDDPNARYLDQVSSTIVLRNGNQLAAWIYSTYPFTYTGPCGRENSFRFDIKRGWNAVTANADPGRGTVHWESGGHPAGARWTSVPWFDDTDEAE